MNRRIGFAFLLALLAAAGNPASGAIPCGSSRPDGGPHPAGAPLDSSAPVRTFERGGGQRTYVMDPGLAPALGPVVDRIERGVARLEDSGWRAGSRGPAVVFEFLPGGGGSATASLRPGGGVVRIDPALVPMESLDRLAPAALHQYAHLVLWSDGEAAAGWFAESLAAHLAARAEEQGAAPLRPTAEGLVGPSTAAGFGEPDFVDALAAVLGEEGLLQAWRDARGGAPDAALDRALSRSAGKTLPEFVLEHALVRETAAPSPSRIVSSGFAPVHFPGPTVKGVAWWVARFRPEGIGGAEVVLDPTSADFEARLLVRYAESSRAADVVELVAGRPARVPLAGVAALSVVATPRIAERSPLAAPQVRVQGLADYPFRLDGPPRVGFSGGAAVLSWRTASQTDLLGWRIERRDLRDGEEVFAAEVLLPSSDGDEEETSWRWIDTEVDPTGAYTWVVEGITAEGVLAEGFVLRLSGTTGAESLPDPDPAD